MVRRRCPHAASQAQRGLPRTRHSRSPSASLNLPQPQHAGTFGSQRRMSTATSQKCQPPAASPFLGFPYWPTAAGKRSPGQLLTHFSSYFRVRFLSTSIQLTTCQPGLPHTHRFSGSELKGSALISNRLMTEPPGRVPDIPARTSVGERTAGDCTGWGPLIQEGDDHVSFGEYYHNKMLLKHHIKVSKLRQSIVSGQKSRS